jgi:SAM-dependent methyltransferase
MPFLEMVSTEQFGALHDHLVNSFYTQEVIRRWFELKPDRDLDLVGLSTRPPLKRELSSSLDAIIRLFLLGESFPSAEIQPLFPVEVWEALLATRLLVVDSSDASRRMASVALYPIPDVYLVSDRWSNPDHSPRTPFADIVYPALTGSAKQFIQFTSFEPCDDFLELCAGTAPAALLASRSAKNIWATDIAERSVEFAKFNAALNGIHNVKILKGDLFEPVENRTFDRIAAHPPYVPVLKPAEIFYGGGEVGEEITKRIISELPKRLKPGGRLYCRTMGTERPNQPFEKRVREWLGEKGGEFDVAIFAIQSVEARQFALEETLNKGGGKEQFLEWGRLFEKNEVHELVIGVVIVQRILGKRPRFTTRRTIQKTTPAAAVEWLMRWEAEMLAEGALERLMELRPLAMEGIEIVARHVLRGGEIMQKKFTLSTELPFSMDCNVQPWMALLLPYCDGKATIAELFEVAKKNEWILPDTPPAEFSRLFATLIGGGFLKTDALKLPVAAG